MLALAGRHECLTLNTIADVRGGLVALEALHNVPFEIKRVYYLFDTAKGVKRGFHAHKQLKQLAICVSGSCQFLLDNGSQKESITLEGVDKALYMEGLIWREMSEFTSDCVLMVLANAYYDEADYIRNYQTFLEFISR